MERTTITIGGRHFTDAEFAELIGQDDLTPADIRARAKAIARALGLGSAITAYAAATPDEIAEDVQRNHLEHMTMCAACTWFYCAHYSCDCHGDGGCAEQHTADGAPIAVSA